MKNRKNLYIGLIGLLVVIVAVVWFMYSRSATVLVVTPASASKIFVDNVDRAESREDNEVVKIGMRPGEHEILVNSKGAWPWSKTITVGYKETKTLMPFNVPLGVSGQIVTSKDPDYASLLKRVKTSNLPTSENPKVSTDGKISVFVSGNSIIALGEGLCSAETLKAACPPVTVFEGTETVSGLDFYKERNDVLVFSVGKGIFVIEIKGQGTQNFQPLYQGGNPRFFIDRALDPVRIYIFDAENLMEVFL